MQLYLNGRLDPPLYLAIPDAQPLFLKSIDPVKWARKFDWTNGGTPAHAGANKDAVPVNRKQEDQLYLKVEKSFGGDDWIQQFVGTPLFDEAAGLCDELLNIREERARKKPEPSIQVSSPKEDSWAREDKIRLKKDRLELQLARYRNKKVNKVLEKLGVTEKSNAGKPDFADLLSDLMSQIPGETMKKKGSKDGR